MMSVLLSLTFGCAGLLAIAAMLASWRAYAPLIASLRDGVASLRDVGEVRLSLREHVLMSIRSSRRRTVSRRKPIRHRTRSRHARRVAA
jgi:hypothetical protein